MTDVRTAALDAAIRAHAHQRDAVTGGAVESAVIVTAAAAYLTFLLGGDAVDAATPGAPAAPKAPGRPRRAATTVESAASLTAPAGQATAGATTGVTALAAGTSAALTAPAAAAAASAPAQQAVAAPASNLVAPPTTIQAAAESLKALVQDKSEGRGREVAVALLKEFKVEQLAQIPAAQLADFKQRCDTAGKGTVAMSGAIDPTGGLLG